MYNLGYSAVEVAHFEGVTPRAVYGIVSQYKTQNEALDWPRSGRPPKLTEYDKRHIKRIIKNLPFISIQSLMLQVGVHCSDRIVLH